MLVCLLLSQFTILKKQARLPYAILVPGNVFLFFCHCSPNSSSSSSSPPKNVTLYCHNIDGEPLEMEDTSRNRPVKKCRSYSKSKRSRRRQGSHSSADRSPATKRSPASSESKICLDEQNINIENGCHVNPLCNGHCEVQKCTHLSKSCSPVSCPRDIPGPRTSNDSFNERRSVNSSDSGPHPASSCESDEDEAKKEEVPNDWNASSRTYNNNQNVSKRTRDGQDETCLSASSEDGCESSDIDAELAHNVMHESFEFWGQEGHIRRIVERPTRPASMELYEVWVNLFHSEVDPGFFLGRSAALPAKTTNIQKKEGYIPQNQRKKTTFCYFVLLSDPGGAHQLKS